MNKPIEYICIKSGHSAILQRKDNLLLSTEGATQAETMALMRQIDPELKAAILANARLKHKINTSQVAERA